MYPDADSPIRPDRPNQNLSDTKVSTTLNSDISIPGSDFEILGENEIKPAKILADSMMMITYCWELEGVERDHKTMASRMISFRGEKVFRVGLKNRLKPTLLFMAINLNEIGMRVREVGFDRKDRPSDNRQSMNHNNVDGYSLQLFTFNLPTLIVGNCSFVFSIWLEGSVPRSYAYTLTDRLVKQQLWAASLTGQHLVDVQFVCKERRFSAHKAILAARSPVFAVEFEEMAEKEQTIDVDTPLQIHIEDVDESVLEEFLYFLYTGEAFKTSMASEQLLKLARRYQLNSLMELCEIALEKVDVMQMASFVSNLDLDPHSPAFRIRPDKDTELTFGQHESTYRCVWLFQGRSAAEKPLAIDYQNENLFSLHLKDDIVHFICLNHRKFVKEVLYSTKSRQWHQMKPKNAKHKLEKSEMLFFVAKCDDGFFDNSSKQAIHFDVKMISTIGNYGYEMTDVLWMKQLWHAALNKQLTDVDIYVGNKKVMEAHQVILSTRSPVLCDLLGKLKKHNGRAAINFEADIDYCIVKHFLYFLYTGTSKMHFGNKHYLKLAENHGVKTLTEVCKLAMVSSPDVDEVTNFLLANF